MDSLWRETVKLPRFEPLEGDFTTDVLVIGGGLAGLVWGDQLPRHAYSERESGSQQLYCSPKPSHRW